MRRVGSGGELCARKWCSVRIVSSWEEVGSGMPNFAHESAVLCAELFPTENFAHERGVLCAELLRGPNFVHEKGGLCA